MLTEEYDRVRIISLPDRTDRRREMAVSLKAIGAVIGGKIEFFDAKRPTNANPFNSIGAHGCYLSHLAVLQEAAGNNESVLIVEDDCDFDARAKDYLVPENCDLLFAGFQALNAADPYNSIIQGAHCTGYSRRAAKTAAMYLTNLLDPAYPADAQATLEPGYNRDIRPPFDGALVWLRRKHPELRVVFDNLSEQRPSRSDITPLRMERWSIVRLVFALARRWSPRSWKVPHFFTR